MRFNLGLSLLFSSVLFAGCQFIPTYDNRQDRTVVNNNNDADLRSMKLPKKMKIPVKGVSRDELTDTWGAARSGGRRHEGIDIMAPRGTKVYSTTNGVVSSLKNNRLGGKVIWIKGPAGSWHYYAHLNKHKAGLKVGDQVKAGDHIAYVGNTGNARHTAPHLHYGLYLKGRGSGAVNPYRYLR